MTANELIAILGSQPILLAGVVLAPVLLALACGAALGAELGRGGWRWLASALVYWSCVPGILAALLCGYALLFTRKSLLDVNLLVYVLPLVAMVLTLLLLKRHVDFELLPGFDRLSGLLVLIAVSFVVAFALSRTRIWLIFGGSMLQLLLFAAAAYLLLQWGSRRLLHGGRKPGAPATGPED